MKPSADEGAAAGSGAASAGTTGSGAAGGPDDAQAASPRTRNRFKHLEFILIMVWRYGKES
ncbi:MAG: hypothetical protein CME14_10370 [Gemmatimonadetes bacterium]|nr:hypothetical protein [Gemmatimonadota bacterium]